MSRYFLQVKNGQSKVMKHWTGWPMGSLARVHPVKCKFCTHAHFIYANMRVYLDNWDVQNFWFIHAVNILMEKSRHLLWVQWQCGASKWVATSNPLRWWDVRSQSQSTICITQATLIRIHWNWIRKSFANKIKKCCFQYGLKAWNGDHLVPRIKRVNRSEAAHPSE